MLFCALGLTPKLYPLRQPTTYFTAKKSIIQPCIIDDYQVT
jgi:hypothetical protein